MSETEQIQTNDLVASTTKEGKAAYCKMGWKLSVYLVVGTALQFLFMGVFSVLFGEEIVSEPWFSWLMIAVPLYVFAFPLFFLLVKKAPKVQLEQHKMGVGRFICCIFMAAGICGVGAVIGAIVNFIIILPFGVSANNTNALGNLMLNSKPFLRILVAGFLAPIFEELIFRKLLIDRVVKYGEWIAILTSGLLFGLFHGNFSQFFFAMGLGLFYAFIYIRTGKIWYTILLHMIQNLSTSVISVWLLQNMDLETLEKIGGTYPSTNVDMELVYSILPGLLLFLAWFAFLVISVIVGIVMWCIFKKKMFTKVWENQIPKGKRIGTAYGNWGMISFIVLCVILFVYSYCVMILT